MPVGVEWDAISDARSQDASEQTTKPGALPDVADCLRAWMTGELAVMA
jgi:hypothetical protein